MTKIGNRTKNILNQRFGRLIVTEFSHYGDGGRSAMWKCLCDCGKTITTRVNALTSGNTTSCGCSRFGTNASNYKHGLSRSPEYAAWRAMILRCYNTNMPNYSRYGGRGIKVCDRWLDKKDGFANFYSDMGSRPESISSLRSEYSIERINNDGNYCPENCRWATQQEQDRNKRNNHMISFNGRTLTITEWSKETNLSTTAINYRLNSGWSIEDSLTLPSDRRRRMK